MLRAPVTLLSGRPLVLSWAVEAPAPLASPTAAPAPAWPHPGASPTVRLPPTGLHQPARMVRKQPLAYAAGAGQYWSQDGTWADLNAGVDPGFAGLSLEGVHEVRASGGRWLPCEARLCFAALPTASSPPRLPHALTSRLPPPASLLPHPQVVFTHMRRPVAALGAALRDMRPRLAADVLSVLEPVVADALSRVAPGGTSALALTHRDDLLRLLNTAADCSARSLKKGRTGGALAAPLAALAILSHLRFGGTADAAPFAEAGRRLKAAVTAAVAAGAEVSAADVRGVEAACARADRYLHLTTWLGYAWLAAAEEALAADAAPAAAAPVAGVHSLPVWLRWLFA